MWSENEIHKSTCKQQKKHKTLWDSMTTSEVPKESYHPMDLDHQYTHIRSQCHMKTSKKIPAPTVQPLPPGWPLKWHLLGSPRYSKWGDLCLLQRRRRDGYHSFPERGKKSWIHSDFFCCKHVNAPFIHPSCRWMGPIVEQKEVPHV